MSFDVYVQDIAEAVGKAAVLGAGAAVLGAGAVVLGAGAVALGAGVGAVAGTGYLAYKAGAAAFESAKILYKEKQYEKDLLNKFKNILNESQDEKQLVMTKNTIITYLQKSDIFDEKVIKSVFNGNKNLNQQIQDGLELMEIENKYKILSENILDLNKSSELYDVNIEDILEDYNSILKEKSISLISKKIIEINNKISEKNQQIKEIHEEKLKGKKFTSNFISFEDVEEKLMIGVFDKEITNMLEQKTDDILELVNEKKTIDLLISVYEMCSIMSNNPLFEEYSNKIISLWSSCIMLTENDSISIKDYEYEVDLKIRSLHEIKKNMDEKSREILEANQRFNQLLIENNNYRKLLNLDPSKIVFNYKTYIEDSKYLKKETEMLIEDHKRKNIANYISLELKRRYVHENYKYIPTNNDEVTENHYVKKNYFITPDGQNVLCLNVNENGQINEEVFGMKIFGLTDDAKSIYEAQTKCCSHTKKILSSFFEQINYNGTVTTIEPDINNTIISRDFTGILPDNVINNVKNTRLKRTQEEQRKRAINNG